MVEQLLTQLKLARIREVYQEWIERASREEMSYGEFLNGLLTEEVCARKENQLKRRMRQARFPYEKTIEQFDFTLRPELKRQVILSCMDPTFISSGKSLVLVGPPGTGKTHLAISIGVKMIQLGYNVRFIVAQRAVNEYVGLSDPDERRKQMMSLSKADLLIVDEFGYLPYDSDAGPFFYQLVSDRYERKGTIITSNKSLRSWSDVLHDSSLASALIDRLLHHGEVFYLRGNSYRLKGKKVYSDNEEESDEPDSPDSPDSPRK